MNNDDDIGSSEYWRDIKEAGQERRQCNSESNIKRLQELGIPFISKNDGTHLIVTYNGLEVNYWPSRNKWYKDGARKSISGNFDSFYRWLIKHSGNTI